MGLGPPVCIGCQIILSHDFERMKEDKDPWYCPSCGKDLGNKDKWHSWLFGFVVKEADKICKNTDEFHKRDS